MPLHPLHCRPHVSHAAYALSMFVVNVYNVHPNAVKCVRLRMFCGDFVECGSAITMLHAPRFLVLLARQHRRAGSNEQEAQAPSCCGRQQGPSPCACRPCILPHEGNLFATPRQPRRLRLRR
eukprot:3295067-Pleurochrysis_carterae.AAC.1